MFFLGAAFCYFFVIPIAYNFLINFGGSQFVAMPKIGEYVVFFTKLVVAFGISFELPIVTFFLAKIGFVTDESLKGFFRYAIVVIFIFAAVMTPPDILSQFLLAVPLIVLYGFSIYIYILKDQSSFRTARKAFWGTSTLPICFIRFLPRFCFSNSLRLRLTSPP